LQNTRNSKDILEYKKNRSFVSFWANFGHNLPKIPSLYKSFYKQIWLSFGFEYAFDDGREE